MIGPTEVQDLDKWKGGREIFAQQCDPAGSLGSIHTEMTEANMAAKSYEAF